MKNVVFKFSFEAENEQDLEFANSIVDALAPYVNSKVEVGNVNAKVEVGNVNAEAPAAPAPAPAPAPAATTSNVVYTCEDARKAMASKLANHRTALIDKLRSLGAKNISTLAQGKYKEFIDFCNSLED